jgi:hypothetical protein
MKPLVTGCALVLAGYVGLSAAISQEANWVPLFNGKDLTGWTVKCQVRDRGNTFWTVKNGTIECNSMGHRKHDYVWLMTDKEYEDFELKLKFQAFRTSPGNSGVQIRSRYDTRPGAPRGAWLDGPQVDIHPPAGWRTGLIYDETREERRWIHPSLKNWAIKKEQGPKQWLHRFSDEGDGWNEMTILCQGTRIKTTVNGFTISDYDGRGVLDNEAHRRRNVGLKGHIALQLHAKDQLRIRFKDLLIREL